MQASSSVLQRSGAWHGGIGEASSGHVSAGEARTNQSGDNTGRYWESQDGVALRQVVDNY